VDPRDTTQQKVEGTPILDIFIICVVPIISYSKFIVPSDHEIFHNILRSRLTGPDLIMLLILLGTISKLTAVSAHCHVDATDYRTTDWTNVSSSAMLCNVLGGNMWK
jgi:hypothetical protein